MQQNPEISTSTNIPTISTLAATPSASQNIIGIKQNQQQAVDQSSFYTLQFPTIVSNPNLSGKIPKNTPDSSKTSQVQQNQYSYNINVINPTNVKTSTPKTDMLSNVVVNSNGEVINIANVGDFETILGQGNNSLRNKCKKRTKDLIIHDDTLVKIDLTDGEVPAGYDMDQNNIKYEKLPHIKNTSENKYTYSLKIDDKNTNQTVIFSNSEYNQNYNANFTTNNTVYTQPNINVVTNTITSSSNIICNTTIDNSSLNLNVLNQNIPETNSLAYPNVSAKNSVNTSNTDSHIKTEDGLPDNNIIPTSSNATPQKLHVCEICLKSFKRREHLGQHIKLHTGFRPYICEHCQKSFMRKEHLMRHSTLHSGQKNYTCNICEKSFSRNDNLLKHKKTHEKQSSYTCEICQKHFVMKHYYNAHKLTHGDKCFVSTVWGMLKT